MKVFKKSCTNIRRTPYQALAAIMVLTITFFVIITVSYSSVAIYQALNYFETRPQVLIFFNSDVKEANIHSLKEQLLTNPEISEVKYVPQEEALSIYQELTKNDPVLLELVTADILPPSLEISTTSLEALKQVAVQTEEVAGVDEVVLMTNVVDVLNKWLLGIRMAGIAFIVVLTITSILITGIVVGMKIGSKNYEIQILKLLGAKTWYIQGPFLVEGAIYGFISSLLANFLVLTSMLYATPVIIDFAGEVPLLPQSLLLVLAIILGTISMGVIIGTLGSWLAVKRYIRR